MPSRNENVIFVTMLLSKGWRNFFQVTHLLEIHDSVHLKVPQVLSTVCNSAVTFSIFEANGVLQVVQVAWNAILAGFSKSSSSEESNLTRVKYVPTARIVSAISVVTRLVIADVAVKIKGFHLARDTAVIL